VFFSFENPLREDRELQAALRAFGYPVVTDWFIREFSDGADAHVRASFCFSVHRSKLPTMN